MPESIYRRSFPYESQRIATNIFKNFEKEKNEKINKEGVRERGGKGGKSFVCVYVQSSFGNEK